MLLNLNIKNIAVFKDVSIDFEEGFNVITGETGAGKSVLIETLFLLIGARASRELIRNGSERACISAAFDISNNQNIINFLKNNNILIDEGDYLIISREILSNGKSINKINNNIISMNILKEMGFYLLDIYGQFEQQYIYKKDNHIILLDNLAGNDFSKEIEKYRELYKEYTYKLSELRNLETKLVNKDKKLEQYSFEIDEITQADLKQDEEDVLLKELKRLSNMKDIMSYLQEIEVLLSKNDNSALNLINHSYSLLNKISNYDEHANDFVKQLDIIIEELQNLSFGIINYEESLELNQERLDEVEERISLINKLKRKYGFSIDKIFEYRDNIENEYTILSDADNKFKEFNLELKVIKDKLENQANILTEVRKKTANYLEGKIIKELDDLNMKNVKFSVVINKKSDFAFDGIDDVEFLMSTNAGSDLCAIQKIVSGGEASRIMLALKKIGSDSLCKSTMVFDEIDTGISGKTAQMAGNKMKYISNKSQVICITHSPQIASISRTHYLITKNMSENSTYSYIKKLEDDEKVYEIARLLSGMNITQKSLNNAKELIEENK